MTRDGFVFNRSYEDREQVREWLPEFAAVREDMEARGEYPYNDSFKGRIPGIVGEDEDTAIYLLQGLYRIGREREEIAAARAAGYRELEALEDVTRFASVVVWHEGHYVGGTGRIDRFESARIVPRDGKPFAVLPKGRRTRGYSVNGATVLVLAPGPR